LKLIPPQSFSSI